MKNQSSDQYLSDHDLERLQWRISSASGNGPNCVEVAPLDDGRIAVRHSHHPDGALILYTRAEWDAFLAGAQGGEFDFQ